MRKPFDNDPNTIKDSFKEKEITTDSGLHIIRVSFNQAYFVGGKFMETRQHNYIVTNAQGRFVLICYGAIAKSESEAVHQMIRKTLQLK